MSRYPIILFLLLVFPLSWFAWVLGLTDGPHDAGLNPLGPLVAALVAAAASRDFRAYLKRVVRVRAGFSTYAIALCLPPALCLAAAGLVVANGAASPMLQIRAHWQDPIGAFFIALLLVALGEEPGWRGFLFAKFGTFLPGPVAALAVAPVWALWHLPLLGTQLELRFAAPFVISLAAGSIILGWLTNRARGGVLPAMLCHAMVNATGGNFVFHFFDGRALVHLWWTYAALWTAAALLIAGRWERMKIRES